MGAKTKRRKAPSPIEQLDGPTEAQIANGEFGEVFVPDPGGGNRVARAHRRICMIDSLKDRGKLTDRQHKALGRYRDIVTADERSPIKDSVAALLQVRGGNGSMPISTYASIERGFLERELGALRAIAYAIAFEDLSPSQWAMKETQAIQRERNGVVWFEPPRKALDIAMIDIRMAGERLAGAIDA